MSVSAPLDEFPALAIGVVVVVVVGVPTDDAAVFRFDARVERAMREKGEERFFDGMEQSFAGAFVAFNENRVTCHSHG